MTARAIGLQLDPVEVATTAIANVLQLLLPEDRRIVVQGLYNVEMRRIGNSELLQAARPLGVLEAIAKRRERVGGAGTGKPTLGVVATPSAITPSSTSEDDL